MDVKEILEQIEVGLKGVTPGPWRRKPMKGYTDDYVLTDHPDFQQPRHGNLVAECGFSSGKIEHRYEADAAHIARCDPDTMRAIIDYVRELEARADRAEAKLRECRLEAFRLEARAEKAEAENNRLREALANTMGHLDTPIARRRLGLSDIPNWLIEARTLTDMEATDEN